MGTQAGALLTPITMEKWLNLQQTLRHCPNYKLCFPLVVKPKPKFSRTSSDEWDLHEIRASV